MYGCRILHALISTCRTNPGRIVQTFTQSSVSAAIRTAVSDRRWLQTSVAVLHPIVSFPLAQTGEGIAECEVVKWSVKEGERIEKFDKLCEVQSDKATIDITSPYSGTVISIPHEPGDIVKVGHTLMKIDVDSDDQSDTFRTDPLKAVAVGTSSADPNTATIVERSPSVSGLKKRRVLAAPTVRLFAKENNVDLAAVPATGPKNRVTKDDVQHYINQRDDFVSGPDTGAGVSDRIPIRGFGRGMLKSMTSSLSIPHFHFCDDIDMSSFTSMRNEITGEGQLRDEKLAFLPFLIKALSAALTEFPIVNSSLSEDHSNILQHASHNIGLAVATDTGLVVPVLKDVQNKSVIEITNAWTKLKKDAFCEMLSPDDVTGATITISNVGSIGSLYSTPRIIPPQSAIVALGAMRTVIKVKSENGQIRSISDIVSQPSLPISWGADHRILDGATVVAFSNRWKQFIEDPRRLTLFLK